MFSAVNSAFIIDVQSKLEPDPNEMTAAYMRILIHAVNSSLFPDADPNATTWTGPPSGIVTVQSLLYTSLATSLFASFFAMLGKQWINRYLRNHGGSAADKSRDRQRKLDGLEGWYFHLVIETLPLMLQLALLLLGCALSRHLWVISHTVAGVILAFTLFGVVCYIFFTLVAAFSYDCPYQTPPSIMARTSLRYIAQSNSALAHSLQSFVVSIADIYSYSIKNLRQIIWHLQSCARGIISTFSNGIAPPHGIPEIPLALVATPVRIFEDIHINLDACKADARCIAWVLYSTTDSDVIFSTVQFAADTIWYPEIAGALSPHILANLFFECLLDGQVIPEKLEHANLIGMALASTLSVQLSMEFEINDLEEIHERINTIKALPPFESTFGLVVAVLKIVVQTPPPITAEGSLSFGFGDSESIPEHLSTTCKLWLSRVMLQTVWRWRRVQGPTNVFLFWAFDSICARLMADGGQTLIVLKTNCVLIVAISVGLNVDMCDLYAPIDGYVIYPYLLPHLLIIWQRCIGNGDQPSPPTLANDHYEWYS